MQAVLDRVMNESWNGTDSGIEDLSRCFEDPFYRYDFDDEDAVQEAALTIQNILSREVQLDKGRIKRQALSRRAMKLLSKTWLESDVDLSYQESVALYVYSLAEHHYWESSENRDWEFFGDHIVLTKLAVSAINKLCANHFRQRFGGAMFRVSSKLEARESLGSKVKAVDFVVASRNLGRVFEQGSGDTLTILLPNPRYRHYKKSVNLNNNDYMSRGDALMVFKPCNTFKVLAHMNLNDKNRAHWPAALFKKSSWLRGAGSRDLFWSSFEWAQMKQHADFAEACSKLRRIVVWQQV